MRTSLRETSEALAIKFGVIFAVLSGAAAFIFNFNYAQIPISGLHSIISPLIFCAAVFPLVIFNYGYHKGLGLLRQTGRDPGFKLWRKIFNGCLLSVAYGIFYVGATFLLAFFINAAFRGATFDRYGATFFDAAIAGIFAYTLTDASLHITATSVINILIVFLLGGTSLSMVTNNDPRWWQSNLSLLGTLHSNTFFTFNLTLILSGLLMLVLFDYLFNELRQSIREQRGMIRNYQILQGAFTFIAIGIICVGIFPANGGTILAILHSYSAYAVILGFLIIIAAIKWLLPNFDPTFYETSYLFGIVLFVLFILLIPIHYLNATSFELLSFFLAFSWLYLFLKAVVGRKEDLTDRS